MKGGGIGRPERIGVLAARVIAGIEQRLEGADGQPCPDRNIDQQQSAEYGSDDCGEQHSDPPLDNSELAQPALDGPREASRQEDAGDTHRIAEGIGVERLPGRGEKLAVRDVEEGGGGHAATGPVELSFAGQSTNCSAGMTRRSIA
jgi:hypothetical protein